MNSLGSIRTTVASAPAAKTVPNPAITTQAANEAAPQQDVAVISKTPVTEAAAAPKATHGASCPCCMEKAAGAVANKALAGVPMGAAGAYLQMKPELRERIDKLPVKPQEITHVLYHADCFDGFGARFAAETALGDKATYIPVSYKDPIPQLPADAKVAIVDFSYPREQLLDLNSKVAGLVVLDHHEKARQALEGLPMVVFEQERAGSGLAWSYFNGDKEEPAMLKYVEDRDLWKWELPQSREVSAAIGSLPMNTEVWKNADVENLKVEGVAIMRAKQQLVDGAVKRAFWGTIDGHKVPITSCSPELRSEVGEGLRDKFPEAPFTAIFYYNDKGGKEWSLRSEDNKTDVNEIAKKFGGGGHKAAAGFRDPGPTLPTELTPPPLPKTE